MAPCREACRPCSSPSGRYSWNRCWLSSRSGDYVVPNQPVGSPPPPEAGPSPAQQGRGRGATAGSRGVGGGGRKQGPGVGAPAPLQAAGAPRRRQCQWSPHSELPQIRGSHAEAPRACAPQHSVLRLCAHTDEARDEGSCRRCPHASPAASPVGRPGGAGRRRAQPCRQTSRLALRGPAAP